MNEQSDTLIRFDYTGRRVRTLVRDGEPWFVAADVCDVLDISNSRDAASRLDNDEKDTVAITDGTPGNPNTTVINEAGVYRLVFTSRKPEAERFKRWLAHEVLPEIRRTGRYQGHSAEQKEAKPKQITPLQALAEATQHLVHLEERQSEMEGRLSTIEQARREADRQLHQLPAPEAEAPEKSPRARLNEIVRAYAQATSTFPQVAWRQLYTQVKYRMGVDVYARARHRDVSKIQVLEDDGLLEDAYAVACAVFEHALPDRFRPAA